MTSVEPENNTWGYICVLVFFILSIWLIIIFTKHNENDDQEKL